jgi:aminoglycoside phosphotransferase (APT) family kinase protein
MEFLKGRIYTDPSLPELSPDERLQLWKAAIVTLAKLHAVSYKEVGLEKFGRPGGYYTRQMKTLGSISQAQADTKDIKTGREVGPVPHFKELLNWFAKNLPQDRTCIIHGDYKLDNMVRSHWDFN